MTDYQKEAQERMIAALERKIAAQDRHIEELQAKITSIPIKMTDGERMDQLRAHIESTHMKCTPVTCITRWTYECLLDKEARVRELQLDRENAHGIIERRNKQIAELEAAIRHLEAESHTSADRIAELDLVIEGFRFTVSGLEAERTDLECDFNRLGEEVEGLRIDRVRLDAILAEPRGALVDFTVGPGAVEYSGIKTREGIDKWIAVKKLRNERPND